MPTRPVAHAWQELGGGWGCQRGAACPGGGPETLVGGSLPSALYGTPSPAPSLHRPLQVTLGLHTGFRGTLRWGPCSQVPAGFLLNLNPPSPASVPIPRQEGLWGLPRPGLQKPPATTQTPMGPREAPGLTLHLTLPVGADSKVPASYLVETEAQKGHTLPQLVSMALTPPAGLTLGQAPWGSCSPASSPQPPCAPPASALEAALPQIIR